MRAVLGSLAASIVATAAACAPPFDANRVSADPGTFGERVVTLMCKRLAYEADPTDVRGDTYRDACRGGALPDGAPASVAAIVNDRARLVAAIDAAVPADQTDALQTYVTSDGVLGMYDDDTMSNSVESLGRMLVDMGSDGDSMSALARMGVREGYRTPAYAIGPAGAFTGATHITDVLDHVLPLIVDGGAANAEWNAVVDAMAGTLGDAAQPSDYLSATRTAGIMNTLLLTEHPELAEATPVPFVVRDRRGIAQIALVAGALPSPFVDADKDGLPDVDALGRYVDANGAAIPVPSPFPTTGDTATRDMQGRALASAGGAPLYVYKDVTQTLLGALGNDAKALVDPGNGTAMDLTMGASLLLGERVAQTKTFDDGQALTYNGYDVANSPLLDMAYAYTQLLRDPLSDDVLALTDTLFDTHQAAIARLLEDGIVAARTADNHPEAQILLDAPFWDDMRPLIARITADPKLVADLLAAMQKPEVKDVINRFADFMTYKDRFDIDPTTQAVVGSFVTMVDHGQPDSGANRSIWQRLAYEISATNGAQQCNKQGAVAREPTTGLVLATYNKCALFTIPSMAVFYLQSIAYSKDANGNIVCESNAGSFAATKTATTAAGCAAFGTGWRPQPKANFNYQWGAIVSAGLSLQGGDQFLENQATIVGMRTHPTPEALNRAQFLDPTPAALKDLTDDLTDKYGQSLKVVHSGGLPVWEKNNFYNEIRPLLQAFADANQEQTFVDIISVMHEHWSTKQSTDTEHTDPSGNYTYGSGLVTWEPLIVEVFKQDVWPALCDTSAELTAIHVNGKSFAQIAAHSGNYLTSPLAGLTERSGATTSTTSDGQLVSQLTPWQLLADAYTGKHARLGAAGASAKLWTDSVPELVDILFRGSKDASGVWHFNNPHMAATTRGVTALLRGRLAAHVADRDAWLSKVVTQDTQDFFTHPLFAALSDFMAKLTADGQGRDALGALLAEIMDPSNAGPFNTLRVGNADLTQLAFDDNELVPLAHIVAKLLVPEKAYLHTQLAFLNKLHQADSAHTLNNIIARIYQQYAGTEPGIPALSAIVDGVGDVDRVDGQKPDPWDANDYSATFQTVGGFLQEEQHGLPRFITIVKGRNQ